MPTTSDRPDPSSQPSRIPVVGVGASAGGLEACIEFLGALPLKPSMAFVLVQHLEPHHVSHLPEILARSTSMRVSQAADGDRIEQNHLYVVPPNAVLTVRENILRLAPRPEGTNQYFPIDQFFHSLAQDQGTHAIAVVLSGSSSDGARGLRAVKCAGGTTLCQTEESAKYGGMPHSAIATGAVDFILPPHALGAEVARIGAHPYVTDPDAAAPEGEQPPDQQDVQKILTRLRNSTKVDFTQYKPSTILRRIGRRMLVHNIETIRDYVGYLDAHPGELGDLYGDILISVTQFFRDPGMFTSLARKLSETLKGRERDTPVRIWSAGCATGEEAYSLAILIIEVMEASGISIPIQIFGTDISDTAIDRARAGIYPEQIQQEVSAERLSRFFTHVDSGYRIAPGIRENCIFARHDLIRDPPFSQLDLVSCRNVLIYLGTPAQQRILPALHYSLKPDGLLVLGSAESIGARSDLFQEIDNGDKIFVKMLGASRFTMTLPDPRSPDDFMFQRKTADVPIAATLSQVESRAGRILRDLYASPGVTINESMQILHFHGQTSLYLEPPSGEASLNLLRVAHQSLLFSLRKAIDTAADQNEAVYETGVHFERNGQSHELAIRVVPIREGHQRFYLVLFERSAQSAGPGQPPDGISEPPVSELQLGKALRELDESREYLRRITEQHEVAMEELRAAHEEVQSSNEEMQSTNEELRTAKEELQSSNEELITVNDELHNRNDELASANSDLNNVLNAVNIPIIMVGMDFRIRRYTPAAERFLNAVPADVGRVIFDVHYSVDVPKLKVMLTDAIQTLAVQQTSAQSRDGRWYSVVVRPYRTLDDRIDGAVVTFIDVDDVTRALSKAEQARDFAEGIVETVQHPLLVLDNELRVQRATSSFYRMFQVTPPQTLGQAIHAIGNRDWDIPELRALLDQTLIRDIPFHDLEVNHDFPRIGRRTMRLNAKRISGRDGTSHTILLAIEDVTERKEAAEIQYRRLFESAKDAIVVIDGPSGLVIDVNPFFLELTRYPRTEIVGKSFWEIAPFRKAEEGRRLVPESMENEVTRFGSVHLQAQDGRQLIVEIVANRYRVKDQILIQVNIRDVTERRQAEEDLRRSNLDLQQFAFAASHDLQEPLRTVINQVQLLEKQYKGKLDTDADEIIQFITSATDGMRHMVLDLLSYAQTSRANIAIVPSSVEVGLASAMSNLQLAIQNVGARITFDPLPTVLMDPTQLVQLLQNLIGNALKYRSAEPPRIHLSAQRAGEAWIVSVQDNGIGIDPKFHEHIFTVFKRLHGREYPGTGIGLATCKRIVERHGGRLWVESEPHKGSTFLFTAKAPQAVEKEKSE